LSYTCFSNLVAEKFQSDSIFKIEETILGETCRFSAVASTIFQISQDSILEKSIVVFEILTKFSISSEVNQYSCALSFHLSG
jgi:hypothetical protein